MRAILTFNLPADREAFARACKADDLCAALSDYAEQLRKWDKYGGHDFGDAGLAVEGARAQLYRTLAEHGIDLEELWT